MPTVIDRCLQARVKNALEPCWEALFEGTSYGFRPGRGCHDAIAKIVHLTNARARKCWIVDADIKGCIDHVSHAHISATIGPFPARELIRPWLKAGYVPAARVTQRCAMGAPANPSPYRGRNSARGMATVNSSAFFALL